MPGFRKGLKKCYHQITGAGRKKDRSDAGTESHSENSSGQGQPEILAAPGCPQPTPAQELLSRPAVEEEADENTLDLPVTESHSTNANNIIENSDDEDPATFHIRIWHKAYDNLKQDPKTSKYTHQYERLLSTTFLGKPGQPSSTAEGAQNDTYISAVSSDEDKLKAIIERGKEKVETSRRLIEGSLKIKSAIDPVKEIMDIALKNVPQTALPWAIVSSSLEVSHPSSQRE